MHFIAGKRVFTFLKKYHLEDRECHGLGNLILTRSLLSKEGETAVRVGLANHSFISTNPNGQENGYLKEIRELDMDLGDTSDFELSIYRKVGMLKNLATAAGFSYPIQSMVES